MSDEPRFTASSGNVFADLGFEQPDIELVKSDLAIEIAGAIRDRGWTQKQAADVLGIDQPKVSAITRGRLGDFSIERLMKLLTKLDREVSITVHAPPAGRPAHLSVHREPSTALVVATPDRAEG